MKKQNILLLLAAVCVMLGAFVFAPKDAEYGGTDDAAETAIKEVQPDYEPWFESLYEPAGEVESLLFTLQGSIGAGIIFYVIGYNRGKSKNANA
ncbi:energy-coupling factor ABC transporter substrate-binding protein [Granulicatella sp. zg-ZJ]|uniref:energy-coupling factor ABC transporter substrate-binding protein n=1 Tax=unclassified Granulicatella TaxID=2630493 RepID=UPI0013C20580|nr:MULTISPECIES: energy-coupling factor ABC transporter substrate-binding protein [unclassified Granulicatella]MBS4749706.1 energy-coupling factor ABC transporter substrate-binding protein [Carnobacteriaceae bacterium zg-ZUI78]NEW61835.1 energy-coupling factor ABC transporter substrate-binding protein [Granulicatella sp. zg-ZJ]NEW65909.1 energy-coupling factor ABC transporter substrate-binding protein [Granulicatella sp. zg-84]QMI85138.1 energy-coupling factor ABC transporter substrate-binding 